MGQQQITRIAAHKLAKVILHEMCEKVGHFSFQCGYSFTCNGERITVKAATLRRDIPRWDFWMRGNMADKILFVAFDHDFEIEYVWMIPSDVAFSAIEDNGRFKVRQDGADVWAEYEIDEKLLKL